MEHSQAAVLGIGVGLAAQAAVGAIQVQLGKAAALRERNLRRYAAGRGLEKVEHGDIVRLHHIPHLQGTPQGLAMHGAAFAVDQSGAVELAQDGHDAAGAMHILHVVELGGWCHLGQVGHAPRQAVDVLHGEIHPGFMRGRQQVQHGVGGAAHGDVERHGVLESLEAGDGTRQHRSVVLLVPALGQFDDQAPGTQKQILAVGMRCQQGTVAGQAQSQRLGQAVHRIGGEHAGTGAAGGTGGALGGLHLRVRSGRIGGLHHRIHQVELDRLVVPDHLAGFHRPARNEHDGDVQAQCRHQHARGDLVAVGDTHQGVGAMGVAHVFHRIGDQVAAGQRIQHAAVTHGDAVVHGDGVELAGHATGRLDLARHQLPHILQMHMAGHELGEGIGDGDDRLGEILVLHACRAPQGAGTGHVATVGGSAGTVFRHGT